MRMSRLFSQTLREAPADTDVVSHQLLLRAGFVRPLAAGIFSSLPLAKRSLRKIEDIVREEMDAIGGQEITMPVVHPADIWQETGRWYQIGSEMGRFKDRAGRDMALGMTHEEVIGDLVRKEIRSYRQLPALLYQLQTKFRDEPRPRAGLIRVREFTMKDSYSLDADWDGLDAQYRAHYSAYFRIYSRCGLPTIAVKSDTGMMGGKLAHEFMYLTPIGEDTLLVCDSCGYSANREVARFKKPNALIEEALPMQKVETPGTTTIESLAKFLNIPESKTAKAVFMVATIKKLDAELPPAIAQYVRTNHQLLIGNPTAEHAWKEIGSPQPLPQERTMNLKGRSLVNGDPATIELNSIQLRDVYNSISEPDSYVDKFILAIVRGDMEVNETKLANAVKAKAMRPAREDEILAVGAVPGYGSAVGVKNALVVIDDIIPNSGGLVAGANEAGFHLLNVFHMRDYKADVVADIVAAREGDACPNCGNPLRTVRGVEVGNIFKLGTRYSDALGCTFQDAEGQSRPVIMGSYGIGIGRLLACVAEEHHDDKGLIWPISVAPYQVHLVLINDPAATEAADAIYDGLKRDGIEVLYDDREERAGVKFNDADLIGVPLRLTVSKKSLEKGGVELKRRSGGEAVIVPIEEIVYRVMGELDILWAELLGPITHVPYKD
jgi:prolyl-tRNA synthetase